MPKVLKVLLAACCVIFFLALGAFGGCLAGYVASANADGNFNLLGVGIIGGGIAGLWFGIILANIIMAPRKPDDEAPIQKSDQDGQS